MSAKNVQMTEKKRAEWLAAGRGSGEGADYLGWLTIHDINSIGNKHRFREGNHDRLCHWLSDPEYEVALVYNLSPVVRQIRDQFPLPVDETRAIAKALGIAHPQDPHTRIDITMTTDIVLTVSTTNGLVTLPRSVKQKSAFGTFNDIEHAEIERRYWLDQGDQWKFVSNDPDCIPPLVLQNAKMLEPHRFKHEEPESYEGALDDSSRELMRALMAKRSAQDLDAFCVALDGHRGLEAGSSLKLAYYLISRFELRVDFGAAKLHEQNVLDIQRLTTQWSAASNEDRRTA